MRAGGQSSDNGARGRGAQSRNRCRVPGAVLRARWGRLRRNPAAGKQRRHQAASQRRGDADEDRPDDPVGAGGRAGRARRRRSGRPAGADRPPGAPGNTGPPGTGHGCGLWRSDGQLPRADNRVERRHDIEAGSRRRDDVDPRIAGGHANQNGTPAKIGTIPAARATLGAAVNIAITNNTQTNVYWDGFPTFNDDGTFDNNVNYATLVAPIAGIYQIDAGADWSAAGTGQRFIAIGTDAACCFAGSWVNATSGADTIQSISDLLQLTAGEHVYLSVIQTSGGDLKFNSNGNGTFLAMHWVGP